MTVFVTCTRRGGTGCSRSWMISEHGLVNLTVKLHGRKKSHSFVIKIGTLMISPANIGDWRNKGEVEKRRLQQNEGDP